MKERLVCLGDLILLAEGRRVKACIQIDDSKVFSEIDEILKREELERPFNIFREAVEKSIDYKYTFNKNGSALELNGEKGKILKISIHEQEVYIKFRDYILNHKKFKEKQEKQKKIQEKQKAYSESKKADNERYQYKKDVIEKYRKRFD